QALHRIETLWQDQFNQDYHKTKVNHFEKLKGKMPTAIKRTNIITEQTTADEIPLANRNPYFTIQNFIQFFYDL
ncbi:MAG: hypothetical protein ACKOA4_03825, partial [Haliscomenobacter sp.]